MKSLIEIQNEIESLTAQAKELRAREFDRTLGEIVSQMRAYGISVAQVRDALAGGAKAKGKRGRKPKAAPAKAKASAGSARKPAPIKYRGPNGETWTGRGKTPKWITAAVEAGQSVDSFKI
jgi:DNA-binding protein H-NS